MQPNPLLGVVFHWLDGLASGSFYLRVAAIRTTRRRQSGGTRIMATTCGLF